jgi:hypothetical protein
MITDKLRSYGAAKKEVMPNVDHRQHKGLNNRAETSHKPTRQRERVMQRFKSPHRFVALKAAGLGLAPLFRPLSDPFRDGSAKAEHLVENIDTNHRLSLLGGRVAGSQTGTNDAFVPGHGRFDQGSPIVA